MVQSVTKTILFGHMGLELLDHMDEYIAELKLKEPVVEEVVDVGAAHGHGQVP